MSTDVLSGPSSGPSHPRHARAKQSPPRTQAPPGSTAELRSIGYMPALDGIRALAIVLVLFFHGGFAWASGGFIGVDIFFVLSGFLITSLLLAQFRKSATIALGRFWANRARRLLPALLAMLGGVALYAVTLAPADTLGQLRLDSLTTLFYGANWNQIVQGQGYFAALATPSPLVHTWSLAIEEQFYLVWPVVVFLVLRWRRSLWPLLGVSALGAAASAVAMAFLFGGGSGETRVYYGTDTRAQDLLIGAVLAIVMAHLVWRQGRLDDDGAPRTVLPTSLVPTKVVRWALVAAGGAALALIWWMVVAVDQYSTWPYYGGFALLSVATAALLACVVVVPASPWGAVLSLRPVRYLGRISYGLYLWHWPVFLVLNGQRVGLTGWPLFFVRVAVAIAIAVVSFHFLEMPIRRGILRRWKSWVALPAGVGTAAVLLVASTAGATPAVSAAPVSHAHLVPANPGHHAINPGTGPAVPAVAAGTKGPVRVLLLGDSEAAFLAFGLGPQGPHYGVNFAADGVIGCGLQQGDTMLQDKIETDLYGIRGANTWVPCANQYVRWRADLATFHPDVVMLSDGEYEVRNRKIDGRWTHIGQPLFDHHEMASLEQAVRVMSSSGATVILLTAPYYDSGGEQLDGAPWPEDNPARVRAYNTMLHEVAAKFPGQVVVANLNAHADPSGHYQEYIGKVQVRYSDGVHMTTAGGKLVAPWLLSLAHRVGMENRARHQQQASGTPATTAPSTATTAPSAAAAGTRSPVRAGTKGAGAPAR